MKRNCILHFLLLSAVLAGACTKQSLRATYDKQATFIENFISAQMNADPGATLSRSGEVYRLTLHDTLPPQRDSLLPGGKVSLYYACYTLTSASISRNNLVSTNLKSIAQAAGWSLSDSTRFRPDTLVLDKQLLPGLEAGLAGVQPLDEAYILFTGEYGYGRRERGTIPARSALVYQVWINSIDNL